MSRAIKLEIVYLDNLIGDWISNDNFRLKVWPFIYLKIEFIFLSKVSIISNNEIIINSYGRIIKIFKTWSESSVVVMQNTSSNILSIAI